MMKKKHRLQQTYKGPTLQKLERAELKQSQRKCDADSASFACSVVSLSQSVRRITRKAAQNLVQKSRVLPFSNNNALDAVKLDTRRSTARANTG
jgi:hypothetical protein